MRAIVHQIVDRLHVSATPRQVIAAVRAGMKRKVQRDPRARAQRKQAYRLALIRRSDNIALYVYVQRGC